jgi:SAM-dependent methyltransferase
MRVSLGAINPADPFTRFSSFKWLAARKLAATIAAAAPAAHGRLLDVGCGGRRFAHYFDGRVTRYIGFDYPVTFYAEKNQVDVFGDGLRLPFRDDSFDTVVCFEVLEHVKDGAQLTSELARVVRPGGTVILTVPFLWGEHCQPHDYARYTVFGVRELFSRAGLAIRNQQRVGGYWTVAGQRLCYHLEPIYQRLGRWMHTSLSFMVLLCASLLEQLDPSKDEYTMSLIVAHKPGVSGLAR